MASGDPEDFDVKKADDRVSFYVRTGDGAPYRVYLSPARAMDLAGAIVDVSKQPCQAVECRVVRQALDAAVSRAEEELSEARGLASGLDSIVCVENDTRHEMGLPPKEDE